jgi:hypothetical protein
MSCINGHGTLKTTLTIKLSLERERERERERVNATLFIMINIRGDFNKYMREKNE